MTEGSTQASVTSHADARLLAPRAAATTAFSAQVTVAPADKSAISGSVKLEVKGSNLANVELLPAQGYAPKLAVFTISADKTTATATLDTTKLPDGILVARISAFDAPAGSTAAKEIVAMPARTWTVKNQGTPGSFTAQVTEAPSPGAIVTGPIRLVVTGSNLQNVELLPPTGYSPKYATFTISADRTRATAIIDTLKLPNGNLPVRISAFNAPAGSTTAKEIIAMPTRTWNLRNSSGWHIRDLGVLGYTYNLPIAMNDAGEVVSGEILYKSFEAINLGMSVAAINNLGHVLGNSNGRVYLYKDGAVADMGAFSGEYGFAAGINDAGDIVGSADLGGTYPGPYIYHAVLFRNNAVTDLAPALVTGWQAAHAQCINNAGQVIINQTGTKSSEAWLYDRGNLIGLGRLTVGSPDDTRGTTSANDINNAGQIVGDSKNHAFLYSKGVMTDLSPPGERYSAAYGINDSGMIVGVFRTNDNVSRAFLYRNGSRIDLNSLWDVQAAGWRLEYAYAINNSGQIVAEGINRDGQRRLVLLTPPRAQ